MLPFTSSHNKFTCVLLCSTISLSKSDIGIKIALVILPNGAHCPNCRQLCLTECRGRCLPSWASPPIPFSCCLAPAGHTSNCCLVNRKIQIRHYNSHKLVC